MLAAAIERDGAEEVELLATYVLLLCITVYVYINIERCLRHVPILIFGWRVDYRRERKDIVASLFYI